MTRERIDLKLFSQVIHEIYQASNKMPLAAFQPWLVDKIQVLINFDTAWWGRASYTPESNEALTIHGHYLYHLPDEYVSQWEEIKQTDHIAFRASATLAKAIISDFDDPDMSPELKIVLGNNNICQVLCCSVEDPIIALSDSGNLTIGHLVDFLSLYRSKARPKFDQQDLLMLQTLLPHLAEALSQSFKRYLAEQRLEIDTPLNSAMGVADSRGLFHFMEPQFESMMQQEWADWDTLSLPPQLLQKNPQGTHAFWGNSISAKTEWLGDCTLVKLRAKSPFDDLSEREQTVAKMFALGQTYKEIANSLCRAPATIRNHIQSIYIKLGIKNKAELISLFNTSTSSDN